MGRRNGKVYTVAILIHFETGPLWVGVKILNADPFHPGSWPAERRRWLSVYTGILPFG